MVTPFTEPTSIIQRMATSAMQYDGNNMTDLQAWVDSWVDSWLAGPGSATIPEMQSGQWLLRTYDDKMFVLSDQSFHMLYRVEADYASTPEPESDFLG